jgi:hypothetical protein
MALLLATDILVGYAITDDGFPTRWRTCSLLRITTVEPLDVPTTNP